jgi:hypothetical protein
MVLDNEALADEFFEDTRLLGIMAPLRDYQFCWNVNHIMQIDFRINNELDYEYRQPASFLVHYLYRNHHDGEYLLPEFRHLDFLWLLKGDPVSDEALEGLVGAIRLIKGVQLVTELTHDKLKNRQHLIF